MSERPPVLPNSGRREFIGWFYLAVLFLLAIGGALGSEKMNDDQGRLFEAESGLRELVQEKGSSVPSTSKLVWSTFARIEQTLGAERTRKPIGAEIDEAARLLLGMTADPADVAAIEKGKSQLDREAVLLFGSRPLSTASASRIAADWRNHGYLGELVSAEAFQRAGDKRELSDLTAGSTSKTGLIAAVLAGIVTCSFMGWFGVLRLRAAGGLRPLGYRVQLPALFDADRLALRASALMLVYIVLFSLPALVAAMMRTKLNESVSTIFVGLAMFLAVPALFRFPVLGKKVSLEDLGVDGRNLLGNVGVGLLGFVLELPLALAMASLGELVFSGSHPTHPATQELLTDHTPLVIGSIFFLAVCVAPFWEEIMFRGLLFPALSRLCRSAPIGGLASCLLFGAVHPQGLPIWLALMTVGGMGCALTYHTRSLVPSMVMHAAHNGTMLLLTLLYS